MSISAPVTTPIFTANLLANALIGISTPQFAFAVATGLEIYAGTGLQVVSVDTGTLGVGVGTGLGVTVTPPVLIAALTASFSGHDLLGIMSPLMINGLSLAFSQSLAQANVVTINAGVGVGAGVTTLLSSPSASSAAWIAGFAAAGLDGPNIPQIASAIAQGFDTAAPTAVGSVAIVGPPNIVPGAGAGIGQLK